MAEEWNGGFDPIRDDPEERRVLFAALDSFRQYRRAAHYNITHRRRQNFYALPTPHWQLLAGPPFNLLSTLDQVDDAIDANAMIASEILTTGLHAFGLEDEGSDPAMEWRDTATASDMGKARSTIRQFYRDWSAEGRVERQACYVPVLQDLSESFAHVRDKGLVKVLVPGAGLGRLVFEICTAGYQVEGNEISYHQLLASSWMLNHTQRREQFDLYPFALTFSNHISRADQLKVVKVPDVHPSTELEKASIGMQTHAFERMSMTAADFLTLYVNAEHEGIYDAITTVFFLDTAPNVIRYVEAIRNCLKQGGVWINLGPLLWHFEERGPPSGDGENDRGRSGHTDKHAVGIGEAGSVELTDEEVVALVQQMGFRMEKHELGSEGSGYIHDPRSMLRNMYTPSHWTARKMS
ncbi:methyltransferase family [Lasallia pustulata]|uniref:carnosine N-methyltransferase n=1 Tax=Lasallia pustulata TaxID=136370 RepID=A0A1W5D5D0_9LECA|nr:methyltransferase family [Lasallia pustulata]